MNSQVYIKKAAEDHFKSRFKDPRKALLGNQMKVIVHIPSFFTKEEGLQIGKAISLEEIKHVLSSSAKDKIPSPNGWIV